MAGKSTREEKEREERRGEEREGVMAEVVSCSCTRSTGR